MFNNKKITIVCLFLVTLIYFPHLVGSERTLFPSWVNIARGGGGHGGGGRAGGGGRSPAERAADRAARNAAEAAEAAAFDNTGAVVPVDGTTVIENTPTTPGTQPTPVIPAVPDPDIVTPTAPASTTTIYTENPSVQAEADQLISQNLQLKLSLDKSINANNVKIETSKNVVTLSGNVSSQAQKQAIENYAKSIDGVQAVISNITVNGE